MPKDKDLKRLIRARMDKTGESYTTARAHLMARKDPPAADYAKLAGMSDAAVEAKTGRTWAEWVGELDAVEAVTMAHPDIARWLAAEHGISAWWAQGVTVAYERIRGLRDVGQRRHGAGAGTYDANKSRTIAVPLGQLYEACASAGSRSKWLPVEHTTRSQTLNKTLQLEWPDGTRATLRFDHKGPSRSAITVQHRGLPDAESASRMRDAWHEHLTALKHRLEEPA